MSYDVLVSLTQDQVNILRKYLTEVDENEEGIPRYKDRAWTITPYIGREYLWTWEGRDIFRLSTDVINFIILLIDLNSPEDAPDWGWSEYTGLVYTAELCEGPRAWGLQQYLDKVLK